MEQRATDADEIASIAAQELKDLAKVDGDDCGKGISFKAIKRFVRRRLGKDENLKLNGKLDKDNGKGYIPSHDIKKVVKK
jgi:hypothetical protein